MGDLDRDRIMIQMKDHYIILSDMIQELPDDIISKEEILKAKLYLAKAIEVTQDAVVDVPLSTQARNPNQSETR